MKSVYKRPDVQFMQCAVDETLSTDIDVSGGDVVMDTSEGMDGW